MAGKRGMKHLRGKTREERDQYALLKMEQFIDTHSLYCEGCKSEMHLEDIKPVVATLMMKRYDKLRATLASSTVEIRGESMSDVLKRIAERKQLQDAPGSTESAPVQDQATLASDVAVAMLETPSTTH